MEANKIRYSKVYRSGRNMLKGNRKIFLEALKEVADQTNDYNFDTDHIGGAFIWSHTPQGFDFWNGMCTEITRSDRVLNNI